MIAGSLSAAGALGYATGRLLNSRVAGWAVGICTYFTCSCVLRLFVFSRDTVDAKEGGTPVQWTEMLRKVRCFASSLPAGRGGGEG